MAGERAARALARIDAAARRIEVAAQNAGGAPDGEIEHRYRQLWTHANSAMAELDQLIGSLEP
jgi:hypothetical protein